MATTYRLHESDASAGLTESANDITVKTGGKSQTVTKTYNSYAWMLRKGSTDHMYLIDPYPTIPMAIRKVVKGHNDRYVSGAVIQVKDSSGKVVVGSDGKNVEFTTDGKGPNIINLKKNAVYTLHESTVPKGYTQADDITFRINSDGSVQLKTGTDKDGLTVYGQKVLSTYTYNGIKIVSIDMPDPLLRNLPNSGGPGAYMLIMITVFGMVVAFITMRKIKKNMLK